MSGGIDTGWFHWSDVFIMVFVGNARSHTYWSVFTPKKNLNKRTFCTLAISLAMFERFLMHSRRVSVLIWDTCIGYYKKLKINKRFPYTMNKVTFNKWKKIRKISITMSHKSHITHRTYPPKEIILFFLIIRHYGDGAIHRRRSIKVMMA